MTEPAAPQRTLADLRKEAQITQGAIGRAMGLSQAQVSRIEAKYPDVPFSSVQAYLRALGGHIVFTEWNLGDIWAEDVVADPGRQDSLERRRRETGRGLRSQRPPKN